MPLLSDRRSVFDMLSASRTAGHADDHVQEPTSSLQPGQPSALAPPAPLSPVRPASEYGLPPSRLSHEVLRSHVPDSPPRQEENARTKRFSMLRFRNYSESHLAARAKEDAAKEEVPPVPAVPQASAVPAILKTAPTMEPLDAHTERKAKRTPFKRSLSKPHDATIAQPRTSRELREGERPKTHSSRWRRLQGRSTGLEDLYQLSVAHANKHPNEPPAYGDEGNSELALPVQRFSESSRSDGSHGSSGDQIYGATTTTTHTVSTHTTFFRLPRRNKNRNSLFPLPVKIEPPTEEPSSGPATPRASESHFSTTSLQSPNVRAPPPTTLYRSHTEGNPMKSAFTPAYGPPQNILSFAEPDMDLARNDSQRSRGSSTSSPRPRPVRLGFRGRASTTSSFGRASIDTPAALTSSARNSTSTTGRSSLGNFLTMTRFRQNSDAPSPRYGSPGTRSKSNSFALSREALVVPEREEGDTPGRYLERLESAVSRSVIAGILSKSSDPFAQAVLRSYTRRFPFFGEPIDMSLRKFLLEAELPKETQQVDRVIQAFADRYHECNPGIFVSSDNAYIVAFSLMMLHTDAFNKNNKRKMQKQDYIKNTSGQQVADQILACFYDNICYTPFVHYEEEVDINGERVLPFKSKKSKIKGAVTESGKKPSGPVDPYNLLVEQKLDVLRPSIRDHMMMDDPYGYIGSQNILDIKYLQRAFTHTGTLQIISARSRPAAYEGGANNTHQNPIDTQAGIVDLKITKVGTLWRKATKKKKARSPWQEWGAILTGSQLYLFKNAHWAKGLVHQFMSHQRHGAPRMPVVFKPPLQDFKPDALIKTDNAVALVDATYNRHKHAFTFVRSGGQEEVLLADNETELNDWLGLINYAAAFRAAGVRIRGMVGGSEEDSRSREVKRLDSRHSARSIQTSSGEVTVQNRGLTPQLQRQVMAARRQIMIQKIAEADREIVDLNRQLDGILRNARHLLVLAPIPPKTRDEIVNAAAMTDANIKWLRRDIWRIRCHRDILALDVQLDGVTAAELQALTGKKADKQIEAPPSVKKGMSKTSMQSPPRSPIRPFDEARFSDGESVDDFVDDVFRTPPGNTLNRRPADRWGLPPLQLDTQQQMQHRESNTSTHLTTASATSPEQPSLSHASSTSSQRGGHLASPDGAETIRAGTPTPSSIGDGEAERMMTSSTTPEVVTRVPNLDSIVATPEAGMNRKSVRRSLQRTLRESHQSTINRHRRNKDSESTVRSAGDVNEMNEEGATPGLERAKGRFILHGKQASVVQFGDDWSNERVRLRSEMLRRGSRTSQVSEQAIEEDLRLDERGLGSPVILDMPRSRNGTEGSLTARSASTDTSAAHSLMEDAELAEVYANASPAAFPPSSPPGFDLSTLDSKNGNRQTVIGPAPNGQTQTSKDQGNKDGNSDDSSDEDEPDAEDELAHGSPNAKENRTTVIGPSIHIQRTSSEASSLRSQQASHDKAPTGEQTMQHGGDASPTQEHIDDDDLRRLSEH